MNRSLFSFFALLTCNILLSQGPSSFSAEKPLNLIAENNIFFDNNNIAIENNETSIDAIDANGYRFEILDAGVNTKYSELGSGFFRNKFIMVSSKKLGGLAKIDPNTREAYKELFCLDINKNGRLSLPLLFSRILNTNNSEDQVAFSPDQRTIYYTRSNKKNSLVFKLYKATLEEGSVGNWINQELLSINKENVSIENPFVNPKGDKLYFSSNAQGTIGGYDIFVSNIDINGNLDTPKNLGSEINTPQDEKYPSLSIDGKYLYFSSKGHRTIGGYDIFTSKILKNGFKTPRNLGNTINTKHDEIAYFLAAKNKGYVSTNSPNGKGGFDIYTATNKEIIQTIKGKTLDLETQILLPNTVVILFDEDGAEVNRQLTGDDATYTFDVVPFESYTLKINKDGFIETAFNFEANRGSNTTYNKNLELNPTEAVITKIDEKSFIIIENIYFDFAKWSIKKESQVSLNKILKVLNEFPDMKIEINAHTDNRGNDSYNLKLSKKRAESAMAYLLENGISKTRLTSHGYGETKPLIDCKNECTEEDFKSNRRIEFMILD